MKHPHASIIKQWLEDTTQRLREKTFHNEIAFSNISDLICDYEGRREFFIKPKLDEYEHLRNAIRDGKKIEILDHNDNTWFLWEIDIPDIIFVLPVHHYRIHDQYRELKEAQEQGKRVVWQSSNGTWVDINDEEIGESFSPERYKIVDYDCFAFTTVLENDINGLFGPVKIKLTKSGIDGKITDEVIE